LLPSPFPPVSFPRSTALISIPRILAYLLLSASLSSAAQSFIFASPNTREHMSDEAAIAARDSFEQRNFLAVARYLAGRLCPAPRVESGEGLDGPGAENSLLITGCQGKRAIYLGELIARYGHQKWALIFDAQTSNDSQISNSGGSETLFVIALANVDSRNVLEQMRRHGLTEGTVVSSENRAIIYVWATDATTGDSVRTFAKTAHGDLREIRGKGFLIGDQDRALAQRILDIDIAAYERRHKVAFSRELWSKKLRDMGLPITSKTPSSPAKTAPAGRDAPSVPPSPP